MIKNNFALVFLLLFSTSYCLLAQSTGRIIQVNNLEGIHGLYNTVKSAEKGDTIVVAAGDYILTDSLRISNKDGITIVGKGKVNLLINSSSKDAVTILRSSNIVIKNIRLQNTSDKNIISANIGILLGDSENVLIDFCSIKNFKAGLYSVNSGAITVKACTIEYNKQWAVSGNFKKLKLLENDFEHNGGLFFINGKNIHSVGVELNNVYMKDNISISNGNGGTQAMLISPLNAGKTKIPSPLSRELKQDQALQQNTTGNVIQGYINTNNELLNKAWIDRKIENQDIFQNSRNEQEELW